jgi:hypothetical protein
MKRIIVIALFWLFSLPALVAQTRWSFELHGGEVYNVPMPLTIRQQGYPDLKLTARYSSESLILPIYVDSRLIRWQDGKSWELEFLHHKLYLNNTTPEIQQFSISHGFNMIMMNRGFDRKTFQYRFGAGFVLTHPESQIRGQAFGDATNDWDMGYFVSGPVVNLSAGKQFRISNRFYLNAEAKTTLAYVNVKVAGGNADVYNVAFHLILGIGYDFIRTKEN